MSDNTITTGGVIGSATAIVIALWAALRTSAAESRADLKAQIAQLSEENKRLDTLSRHWERKALEYAAELKAAADRRNPGGYRGELPTYTAIMDLRNGDPVAEDQARRQPPIDSTPPRSLALEGVRVVETYSPAARPTHPAPPGYPAPAAPALPRPPRGRNTR